MALTNTFDRLIKLNHTAFEAGDYDKASHLLTAALFCASSENDREHCILVEHTAIAQSKCIDKDAPDYIHSHVAASKRTICTQGLFNQLARQAHITLAKIDRSSMSSEPFQ